MYFSTFEKTSDRTFVIEKGILYWTDKCLFTI